MTGFNIKWFQTRWQKCPAFKTSKKCGRADFPLWLCTAHENPLQLLCSPRVVALLPKKYPRQQNPASYIGYTREFLYELPGSTVGHLHLFLKNWQLLDNCPAGGMSMLAIDWVVIQLDYKISSPPFFFRDSRASEMQARENHPTRQKATPDRERKKWGSLIFLSPHRVLPFLAWGDFHACLRFARSTIPEQK